MTPEVKSVPVYLEDAGSQVWTPYNISERPDDTVHITPWVTTEVKDFSQEEFTLPVPWDKPVLVMKITPHKFKVGETGVLKIFKTKCTFVNTVSKDKKIIFSAPIPHGKRDVISTGLAVVGATMRNAGFSR